MQNNIFSLTRKLNKLLFSFPLGDKWFKCVSIKQSGHKLFKVFISAPCGINEFQLTVRTLMVTGNSTTATEEQDHSKGPGEERGALHMKWWGCLLEILN